MCDDHQEDHRPVYDSHRRFADIEDDQADGFVLPLETAGHHATTSCIPRNNFTQNYQFVGNSNEEFQVVYCSKVFGVVKEAHKDKLLSLDIVQGDNRVIVQKEYSFQTT